MSDYVAPSTRCDRCGYSLLTRPRVGMCPECGGAYDLYLGDARRRRAALGLYEPHGHVGVTVMLIATAAATAGTAMFLLCAAIAAGFALLSAWRLGRAFAYGHLIGSRVVTPGFERRCVWGCQGLVLLGYGVIAGVAVIVSLVTA